MQPNIGLFDRFARLVLAALFLWLAFCAFQNVFASLFFMLASGWLMVEAVMGICPLYRKLGVQKPGDRLPFETLYGVGLMGIQLSFAYIWWHAGFEKLTGGFSGNIVKTLTRFADGNPHVRYAEFLENVAIPNSAVFAQLVQWGQIAIGIGLFLSIVAIVYGNKKQQNIGYYVSILALAGGALMNANFYIAGGWTSAGTAGSNIAMFWPQLMLMYVWILRMRHQK